MSDLFSVKSVVTSLKAFVVGIPISIGAWLLQMVYMKFEAFGLMLLVLWAIFALFLWGWIANKAWSWS